MTQITICADEEIPFLSRLYCAIRARAQEARRRRIEREGLRQMRALDDTLLKDLGVTRADVDHVLGLDPSQNASDALWRLSLRNPANRRAR